MQKLAVIVGTNASGKTDLGIRLAQYYGGEIVSADSRQVYRGLDLGSGKVTAAQRAAVPHHLIDVAEVTENYSLAEFQGAAYAAIDGIAAQGKLPLLVGGTGLYIAAVVEGYELLDVPPNRPLRTELERISLPGLLERLQKADPEAADRIDTRNPRRVIRAIELASAGFRTSAAQKRKPRYDCLQLGLTWPRDVLAGRIRQRLADRLATGMIEEVRALRSNGVSDQRLHSLGLEYRYIAKYLGAEYRTVEELSEQLEIAIRQFAKEQLTWFKRDQGIIWLDPFRDHFEQAREQIDKWRTSGEAGGEP